jgi:hypothetical protein
MANYRAVANGNWDNLAIWEDDSTNMFAASTVLPSASDNVYANGFLVTINTNVDVASLNNGVFTSPTRLGQMSIPLMTANNIPSGLASASTVNSTNFAFKAFNRNTTDFWLSGTPNTGILQYQFPTGKIIKRYAFFSHSTNIQNIRSWTFEGSNDGSTWVVLNTQASFTTVASTWYEFDISANTTSYLYYRINVTATQNVGSAPLIPELEMSEITSAYGNAVAGGTFNHTTGGLTITSTALGVGASNLIAYNHSSGTNTLTVVTNVVANVIGGITITTGNVNISMPQITITSVSGAGGLVKNGADTLNFIGNVLNGSTASDNTVLQLNTGIVNVTGNVTGGGAPGNSAIGITVAGATLTVTGNIIGGANTGVTHGIRITSGNLTVIGNVTGGPSSQGGGVASSTTGNITVTGTITAGDNTIALQSNQSSATVQVSGPLINSANGIAALYATRYFIIGTSTTITAQSSVGVNNIFYNNTSILDALSASNVRDGIPYGLGGTLTGTLKVPLPSQVITGVETDNTIGTWALTPTDFWNHPLSNGFASGSVGDRMKNVSTVSSTGAQLAAF